MADKVDSRIQDLPAIDSLAEGDLFPVAREGDAFNARKVSAGQMTDYIEGVAQPYLTGADVMRGWLGWTEANGKFRKIIDLYNTQDPLPRRYPVKYSDEWCAATVTAAGMAAGLQDIIYGECGCGKMIALYEARGLWVEDDAYVPSPGDIIMYDWDDSGLGDNRGNPDHVGIVEQVVGGTITIIEGNKGGAVARRKLAVNGRYIRGYCTPDYAGKAEEDEEMTQEQFDKFMDNYLARKAKEEADQPWEQDVIRRAKEAGISDGSRPRSPGTRVETMAMVLAAVGK